MLNVAEEFLPKGKSVKIICAGFCKNVSVARVAHSLIALRTVGGKLDVVRLLSPYLIFEKSVYNRIFAGEVTCAFHIRINCVSADKPLLVGDPRKLRVAEAHIGKSRAVDIIALALLIYDLRFRLAQVGGIERAVLIQYLAVP